MSKKLKIVLFVAAVTIALLLCYSLIKSFFAVEDNYTITTIWILNDLDKEVLKVGWYKQETFDFTYCNDYSIHYDNCL